MDELRLYDHERRWQEIHDAAPDLFEALKYARNLIGPDEIIDAALSRITTKGEIGDE